jgi:hypothetical protein
MDYVALAHSLFAYALALNVTAPTLPAFREKRQSDDWQLQWYVFANTFTVRCAPIVAMSPTSGLGLALSRLAASVSAQLALAPPMPLLHLGKVYPAHEDSALSLALRDYNVAVPALQGALDTIAAAQAVAAPDKELIRQQFQLFLDIHFPVHLIALPPALSCAYGTLVWVVRIYLRSLFQDEHFSPLPLTPSSLPLDLSSVASFLLPFADALPQISCISDVTPLAVALRALVRAGFEVSYQPSSDVTMISSEREATPATVVLMQSLRTHYDDAVAEMLQDDDTSGSKLMYGLGTWRRPVP